MAVFSASVMPAPLRVAGVRAGEPHHRGRRRFRWWWGFSNRRFCRGIRHRRRLGAKRWRHRAKASQQDSRYWPLFGSSPTAAGSAGASRKGIGSSAASLGKSGNRHRHASAGVTWLSATGLLAGGGNGSLLGGNSQIRRLLGGAGGSLLGGFAAASLINPALLPAFFNNPITAVIGGALIGSALLFQFFGIVSFASSERGRKTIPDQKWMASSRGANSIRLRKSLANRCSARASLDRRSSRRFAVKRPAIACRLCQCQRPRKQSLARKFRDKTELTDISDPRNRFTRRAMGGSVTAGMPYIVGDGGRPESFFAHQRRSVPLNQAI